MAKVHKAIELGAGLNFKIVGGTTQPASPKENTIWVNTDVTIGEYQFSSVQPTVKVDGSDLQNGDVWIKTDDKGDITINVVKKNSINLILSGVYQFDGSNFVHRDTSIYSNGQWVNIADFVWLVTSNDDHFNVTGGYTFRQNENPNAEIRIGDNGIEYVNTTASSNKWCMWTIANVLDVTDYNFLEFDGYCANVDVSSSSCLCTVVIKKEDGTTITTLNFSKNGVLTHYSIPITTIKGNVVITGELTTGGTIAGVRAYLNNMRLVK